MHRLASLCKNSVEVLVLKQECERSSQAYSLSLYAVCFASSKYMTMRMLLVCVLTACSLQWAVIEEEVLRPRLRERGGWSETKNLRED